MTETDQELLRRLAHGDMDALGVLYDRNARRVYHLLLARGLQAAEAIQEGRKLGGEWGAVQKEAIERAKKPRGQTELMVVEPIARLIQAAQ